MFATPKSLQKRTGKSDVDRPTYLKQLVEEYHCLSISEEKKLQVLANLGNFAYDPINYEYFRRLHIPDIFLNNLSQFYNEKSVSSKTVSFSLGSICNLCNDQKIREHLLKNGLVKLVLNCLLRFSGSSLDQMDQESELIVLNSIMILVFVCDETTMEEMMTPELISIVTQLTGSTNKRLANLATVFIQDCYSKYNRVANEWFFISFKRINNKTL